VKSPALIASAQFGITSSLIVSHRQDFSNELVLSQRSFENTDELSSSEIFSSQEGNRQDGGEKSIGISVWLIVVIVIVCVSIAAIAVFLVVRRMNEEQIPPLPPDPDATVTAHVDSVLGFQSEYGLSGSESSMIASIELIGDHTAAPDELAAATKEETPRKANDGETAPASAEGDGAIDLASEFSHP